ncbi:hypothetical protein [Cupriavidus sp. RAF12]|uniref:hypothetical protein n=1 Tax=Cupriavidus sp. RAF12 TaxID=3233050 RepID=UPI003F9271A1
MGVKGARLTSAKRLTKRVLSIRRIRMSGRKRFSLDSFFRHPLFLLFAGFFLTAIVGGSVTYWRDSRDRDAERTRIEQQHSREAIDEMQRRYYEFYQRAAVLIRAIDANVPRDELKEMKRSYDESFANGLIFSMSGGARLESIIPNNSKSELSARDSYIKLSDISQAIDSCIHILYTTGKRPNDNEGHLSNDPYFGCRDSSDSTSMGSTDPSAMLSKALFCAGIVFEPIIKTIGQSSLKIEERQSLYEKLLRGFLDDFGKICQYMGEKR